MGDSLQSNSSLRRSILYVPADNDRAMEKAKTLEADTIVFDLEDAVAGGSRAHARENLRKYFKENPISKAERGIRINRLDTDWGTEDLMCALACMVGVIIVPKVELLDHVIGVTDALDHSDAHSGVKIIAMIETAQGVINCSQIAELGNSKHARLSGLMVGINDLAKETHIDPARARQIAHPWLMQIVLCGHAAKLDVIDAVYNNFRDEEGFADECSGAAAMGFTGKSLIHPNQIEAANAAFAPSVEKIDEAQKIVAAFALPENAHRGVIQLNGKMVELLHLEQAQALLAQAKQAGLLQKG